MTNRILVVDDEESIRFTLEMFLTDEGYDVHTAANYEEAVAALNETRFDLFFVDILIGRFSGIDFLKTIRSGDNDAPVVMITGSPDVETASEAVRFGAFDYIPKPIRQETLLRVARMALRHRELVIQKEAYRRNLDAIFCTVKDGIVLVDEDLRILEINDAARSICDLSEVDIGTPFESAVQGCPVECVRLLKRTLETSTSQDVPQVKCSKESGEERVLRLTATPVEGSRGGVVLVIRDETRINDLERDFGLRRGFHNIVGQSKLLQGVYSLIERLSEVDTTVLVTGESGTGKELVAEAIHYNGSRKEKPFVKLNCAALPETLLESELFGHVKGSFTGALQNKMGRFQKADGGTIFLDEIGDISAALQVRLLRVLQEKQIERVGDSTPIPVDVRIIAATNQNLIDKIKKGEFREDLYYRLKVVDVALPPLRNRTEDIPLLIGFFVKKFNEKFGVAVQGVSDQVLKIFMEHSWPGNVRELEHVVEHAFVLCRDNLIAAEHLPVDIKPAIMDDPDDASSLDEREKILAVLESTDGNKAKASRILNISRRTLYRKISRLEIEEN